MFDHLSRCDGSRTTTMSGPSRDRPDLGLTLSEARRTWLAGVASRLVVGIARKLRTWRAARTPQPQERPEDPDILPNPWLSY
jgi:hypothetical protein